MISVYNTLTKKKEEFIPIDTSLVKMYVCGPTVYDYFHVGNARSFIMSDIIRRFLEFSGYNVKFVMNITDVDDKIIKKSFQEKRDSGAVADKYSEAFMEDIHRLKIKPADVYPKATLHMTEIINLIKDLVDKGFAYNVNGNVFYDVKRFKGYGKLSGKNIDDLESGARIEINEEKKNPLDFSLWKKAKEGEPYWESPWGNGRPGWHIECSAMSCKHLGETFDIHAGGNDLIFPHHENEIAQSEASTGKKFVNYWMHFGFLNINDEKMSKSVGNFFTARDVVGKYSAEALRMFFAQAHYGGPLNFSEELLASSQKGLEKLNTLAERIEEKIKKNDRTKTVTDFKFDKYESAFRNAMEDDFNSPQAIAVIFDFVKEVNKILAEAEEQSHEFYISAKDFLEKAAGGVLGILNPDKESEISNGTVENELIELLITLRNDAKLSKNYALSDKIRDELKNLGIVLQDSKEKTTFKKNKS